MQQRQQQQQQQSRTRGILPSLLLLSLLLLSSCSSLASAADPDDAPTTAARSSSTASSQQNNAAYIVMLKDAPVLTYHGGNDADMPETASARVAGGKLDVRSAAVAAYASFVEAQSVAVAARAGVAAEQMSYKYRWGRESYMFGSTTWVSHNSTVGLNLKA
jgi:hypothetical protein